MPFDDLPRLRDFNEYKKVLKTELGKVKATPVKFQLFDKFKFATKTAPFLVVGKYDNDFIDALKHGGAVFKAKGRCAEHANELQFAADQGAIAEGSLKTALTDGGAKGAAVKALAAGDVGKAEVLAEKQAEGEVYSGPGGSKSEAPKKQAERRLGEVTKFFDGVKGSLEVKLRDKARAALEGAQKALAAGELGTALKLLTAIEAEVQKDVLAQQVSIEKTGKGVNDAINAQKAALKKVQDDIDAAEKRLTALDSDWTENKGQRKGEKWAAFEKRLEKLTLRIDTEKETLAQRKTTLAADLKSVEGTEAAKVKEMLTRFLGLSKRAEDLSRAASAPLQNALDDNPELDRARDDVAPGMQKMADASQFLKAEHERSATDPRMHGSARHGAQGGLDRGAARAATKNEFRPDSPQNRDGVTRHVKAWNKVELTWEDLPDGKKKLADRKLVARTVLAETFPGENPSATTSMFLNPVLEKEAVDQALKVAARCLWKFKANRQPLLELGMVIGKPASAPGWGYSISKIPGLRKKSVGDAVALLEDFEAGTITIDELLKKLNVQIATDRTGAGALLVPFATVVLVRKTPDDPWTSKTHYPDDRPGAVSWEIAGQGLRKTRDGAVEVAPAL